MKKLVSSIALLVALLIATAAYNERSQYLTVGVEAPVINLSDGTRSFDLDDCKGEYVLLTFWTSSDAQSRAECINYDNWFDANQPKDIKHVSVNFDNHKQLFDEIVRLDNLDAQAQYHVEGDEASMIRHAYDLDEGYGSVLISPDGYIKAFNPSKAELSSLI